MQPNQDNSQVEPNDAEVVELLKTLTFVPVENTQFYNGIDFPYVAYNEEFVIFSNENMDIHWYTMNSFYSGEFNLKELT